MQIVSSTRKNLRIIKIVLAMLIMVSAIFVFGASAGDVYAAKASVTSEEELRAAVQAASGSESAEIEISQDFVFEGDPVTVGSGKSVTVSGGGRITGVNTDTESSRRLFVIEKGGKVKLEDAVLDNLWVETHGSFEMTGGAIENVKEYDYRNYTDVVHAVLVEGDGASFVMSGGEIRNNEVGYGTVYVTDKSLMTMTGGRITGNKTYGNGGGVYVYGNDQDSKVEFVLRGGEISSNTAYSGSGGGVCLEGEEEEHGEPHIEFEMTGGVIKGNYADDEDFINSKGKKVVRGGYGGGIYINTSGAKVKGGEILDNDADIYGGGIYLGIGSTLRVLNAIITKNVAYTHWSELDVYYREGAFSIHVAGPAGGGVWACPTGDEDFNINDTLAIFDNVVDNPKYYDKYSWLISRATRGIGDDFTAMPPFEGFKLTICDRTFDGYPIKWYRDGGNEAAVESLKGLKHDVEDDYDKMYYGDPNHWDFSEKSPDDDRFTDEATGTRITELTGIERPVALKSILSEDAKQAILARKDQGVYIAGNTAGAGGGIATNGKLIGGSEEKRPLNIEVKKDWTNVPKDKWEPVLVQLRKSGRVIDELTLSGDNGWSGSFVGLPNEDFDVYEVTTSKDGAWIVTDPVVTKSREIDMESGGAETDVQTVTIRNRKIEEKPEIFKTVNSGQNIKLKKLDDDFTYEISTKIPDNASEFKIFDDMAEALEFVDTADVSVKIGGTALTKEELAKQLHILGNRMTVTFTEDQVTGKAGKDVSVRFRARIRKDADLSKYKDNKIPNIAYYTLNGKKGETTNSSESAVIEFSGGSVGPEKENYHSDGDDESSDKENEKKTAKKDSDETGDEASGDDGSGKNGQDTGNEDGSGKSGASRSYNGVRTADESDMMIFVLMAVMALMLILVIKRSARR